MTKQNVLMTEEFVSKCLQAEKDGDLFPVNFDDVWEGVGYTRKDNAVRALKKAGLVEGQDILTNEELSESGQTLIVYRLSVDGYKHFSMVAKTEYGKQVRQYFIDVEKAYRKQLELQFAAPVNPDIEMLEEQLETLKTAYQASQKEVFDLSHAVLRLEAKLKPFEKQLSLDYDFDLDQLWLMSGLTSDRNYLIKILMDNFDYGFHFTTTPDARPGKGGLPKTKFWLTHQCFNQIVVAIRSLKGVPVDELPETIVIDTQDYFKPNTGKKNKRFPSRR